MLSAGAAGAWMTQAMCLRGCAPGLGEGFDGLPMADLQRPSAPCAEGSRHGGASWKYRKDPAARRSRIGRRRARCGGATGQNYPLARSGPEMGRKYCPIFIIV
ncbi:hypothetical protein BLA6993_01935 [Burkholderia lata]|nr:hypothetical protein BLA6993_01935 [Burkholderia lata]